MLSDMDIRREIEHGALVVQGLRDTAVQPASIDLYLSSHFWTFEGKYEVDPKLDQRSQAAAVTVMNGWLTLQPGDFVLGSTVEYFEFPDYLAGRLEGKSSLGRLGLIVHTTAGFFDPGFRGYPTIELVNMRSQAFRLYPGMPIAQMSIFELRTPCESPYGSERGSKYAGQGQKPELSMYHRNFEGNQ